MRELDGSFSHSLTRVLNGSFIDTASSWDMGVIPAVTEFVVPLSGILKFL